MAFSRPLEVGASIREGAMADIGIRSKWIVNLETPEIRLVLRALGGRLRDDDEIAQAKELGDKLTRLRAEASKSLVRQADQALEAIQG